MTGRGEPFFVIGFQRSGTTLLRMMLDSHPEVAIPLDVTGLWDRYEKRLRQYDLTKESGTRALIAALLQEERIKLWEVDLTVDDVADLRRWPGYPGVIDAFNQAYAIKKGKQRWGDKDPGNLLRLPQLDRWFPGCLVVHIIRDGRAACLSHQTQSFGMQDLLACADAWREQVWWVRRIGELLGPKRYCEVRYEDLVAEPEHELKRVTAFLGLTFVPEMLEYHTRVDQSIPKEKRHIWPLIDRPPQKENADRWRQELSPGAVVCFEKRAGELLREMGYATTEPPWRGAYTTEMRFLLARAYRAFRDRLARRAS